MPGAKRETRIAALVSKTEGVTRVMRYCLPQLATGFLLAFLSCQIATAQVVSAEVAHSYDFGSEPAYGSPFNGQFLPEVAFDGANYLVVWQDYRDSTDYDIRGARMSMSGVAFDPGGIAISEAAGRQISPTIAFDGTNYMVLWQDYRNGTDYDIYAARVSMLGTVLDPAGFAVSIAPNDQASPALAFDGSNYMCVWQDNRLSSDGSPQHDIFGARLSVSGTVLDPSGFCISSAASVQSAPAIAFGDTGYFVTWQDYRDGTNDIYGARVSLSGTVPDSEGLVISSAQYDQWSPTVSFGGENYMIVWEDWRSHTGFAEAYRARVGTSGVVLDPGGVSVSIDEYSLEKPAMVFDGSNYLVVWQARHPSGEYDIYGARMEVSGSLLDPYGFAISTVTAEQSSPAVAFDGTNYMVAWQDMRTGTHTIFCSRISASGDVIDPGGLTELFFASASVTARCGSVNLYWETSVDLPVSSFIIERCESLVGEFVALDLPIFKGSRLSFSCNDYSVLPGKTYWYRILLLSPSGEEVYGPIEVHVDAVPTAYKTYQSYPNPFNPLCTIRYEIPQADRVSLQVFAVSGALVRTLVDGWREPGVHSEVWDGKDDGGVQLPPGIYFYSLKAGEFAATHKTVLLK